MHPAGSFTYAGDTRSRNLYQKLRLQERCTRNLHEKFDASSSQFLAQKQLSSQWRCRFVSRARQFMSRNRAVLNCMQETCTKKRVQDWPTHVQVSCTRRLAQVSVASFLSGITNEITNSVYWQQEHYGTTDIVDVIFWRRLRFPAQSRSRTVAPLHAPCPFHCTLVPRGQQATSRLHHQLMRTERARARITCEWPMHLRQNRAQHLVDNVHNIATIATSSVRPDSLSHHCRSALSSDYK